MEFDLIYVIQYSFLRRDHQVIESNGTLVWKSFLKKTVSTTFFWSYYEMELNWYEI